MTGEKCCEKCASNMGGGLSMLPFVRGCRNLDCECHHPAHSTEEVKLTPGKWNEGLFHLSRDREGWESEFFKDVTTSLSTSYGWDNETCLDVAKSLIGPAGRLLSQARKEERGRVLSEIAKVNGFYAKPGEELGEKIAQRLRELEDKGEKL